MVMMVTPSFIGEVEQYKLPVNIPGRSTQSPSDCELYIRGYTEVPQCAVDCPLPTPVGAIQAHQNVLPQQPYVPDSMPAVPEPAPADEATPPAQEPGSGGDNSSYRIPLQGSSTENSTAQLTGFGYPSREK
jgi:hypothetical protein